MVIDNLNTSIDTMQKSIVVNKPYWFTIIEQWKLMGKGEYGITFPFIVGAIAKTNQQEVTESLINNIFHEIINNPVEGYYCEVRWCENINEPVASVKILDELKNVSIKSVFVSEHTRNISLAFTTDLMSMFNLDCSSNYDCLEQLTYITHEMVIEGNYSKNGGVFTPFTEDDLQFIEVVSKL